MFFCFNGICEKCKRIKKVKWNSVKQTKENRKSFVGKMLFLFMAMMNFFECVLGKKTTFLLSQWLEGTYSKVSFTSEFKRTLY